MEQRYEIRGTLGKGGIGAVYRAFDRHLKREVALKRITPDGDAEDREAAIAQITREAATLSSLQHPHVVTVYDVGTDGDGPFVVMELLTGKSLEDLVERGPLTWQDFRELALQTQEALIAAHDLDLLHLDIKPGNLVLTWLPSGKFQAKLVDFGLAKFAPQPTLQDIEKGDSVYGSIFFMAPEQFERRHLDVRTDLYAMGCVYYHALTGNHPFAGASGHEVMQAHLEHRVVPLPEVRADIPRWASDWVMWHINRAPEERPRDARESLKFFISNDQTLTQSLAMPTEPTSEAPRRPRLLIPGVNTPAQPAPAAQPVAPPPAPVPQAVPVPPSAAQPAAPARPVLLVRAAAAAQPAVVSLPPPVPVEDPAPEPVPAEVAPVTAVSPPVIPAATAMQPTPVAPPQPLTPPEGSRPSVHTEAQQIANEVVHAAQAAQAAPPQEAHVPVVPLAPARPAGSRLLAQPGAPPPAAAQAPAGQQGPVVFSGAAAFQRKKGLSNGAKVAIAAVLAVLVLLLGMLLLSRLSSNKKNKEFNSLVAQTKQTGITEIAVTKAQLELLLGAAISLESNKERPAVYTCIYLAKATDGTDVDAVLADFATTRDMTDDIRVNLFEILARRGNPASVATMLNYAKSTSRVACATAAITNAKSMAKDEHFAEFLDVVQSTPDPNIRRAAEGTAGEILKKSAAAATFADAIVSAYEKQHNADIRHCLLRLMGYAGGDRAKQVITKGMEDADRLTKLNSMLALRNWPDDSMFEPLMDFLEQQEDLEFRKKAFDTGYEFLRQDRKRSDEQNEELWKMLARNAKTDIEQIGVIDGLARQKGEWTIAVIEYFADEAESDRVKDRAGKALDYLRERERITNKDEDEEPDNKDKEE